MSWYIYTSSANLIPLVESYTGSVQAVKRQAEVHVVVGVDVGIADFVRVVAEKEYSSNWNLDLVE